MNKLILFGLVFTFSLQGNVCAKEGSQAFGVKIKNDLKNIYLEPEGYSLEQLDETSQYFKKKDNLKPKEREKFKAAISASFFTIHLLNKKFDTTRETFENDIKDEVYLSIYKTALSNLKALSDKTFYLCLNEGDENKDLINSIHGLRSKAGNAYERKDKENYLKIYENMVGKCFYDDQIFNLLDEYSLNVRSKGNKKLAKKYNKEFQKIMATDQIEFDFMYLGRKKLNSSFRLAFFDFFRSVNKKDDYVNFTSNDLKKILEYINGKYSSIFETNKSSFYIYDGKFNPFLAEDGAESLANLTYWARQHGLIDEAAQIEKKFCAGGLHEYLVPKEKYIEVFGSCLD
jgi:hypothetical protein